MRESLEETKRRLYTTRRGATWWWMMDSDFGSQLHPCNLMSCFQNGEQHPCIWLSMGCRTTRRIAAPEDTVFLGRLPRSSHALSCCIHYHGLPTLSVVAFLTRTVYAIQYEQHFFAFAPWSYVNCRLYLTYAEWTHVINSWHGLASTGRDRTCTRRSRYVQLRKKKIGQSVENMEGFLFHSLCFFIFS